jgi:tetratricopeptide (TPR) repeat protein
MPLRRDFAGLLALSGVSLVLAMPAAFAQNDVARLMEQGLAEDARLDTAHALEAFLEAEKLAPNDANVLYRIAREYALSMNDTASKDEQRTRGEQALAYAKRAVAADPRNAQAQLAAAICYGRLAPFVDTRTRIAYSQLIKQHSDAALALDPSDDYAYHVLGVWNYELAGLNPVLRGMARVIYGALPDASYLDAERDFQKAVELSPARVSHHVELGRTYVALGNKELARKELTLALGFPDREKDDPESKRRARQALQQFD